ncbi:fasciclin domain-containing protein [Alkalitalea saponilacus]|uniref:Uncaracterized surface protein containing fasciclin (FAS1) repeats n=1 Tax=Alkalitalea saponilacus TaxID=889453 RepID=A0A1T5CHD5_9BACT|nr:fasciclin domain-containing protein [Alkalitalea saponilacus]ASB49861.1 hypothetical protein CDL62_12305 [Alkalitalea saponilacus]SKB58530.1 Uncaracterized surface protein containing fasciclin (FAS1) repeats [Alkalitalea saponilacus]
MKRTALYRIFSVLILVMTLVLTSCNDSWDDHYSKSTKVVSDQTLYGYINSKPELSTFAEMLRISGYDKVINSDQSYTVWAPNNAALEGVDLQNEDLVVEIVRNHIARSIFSTSGVMLSRVSMLNGKYVTFIREEAGFSFGRMLLSEGNTLLKNGLLHIIDGYVPYTNNIWEHIGRTSGLDSLRSFLYRQDRFVFDPVNSVEIGYNEDDQPIYDSIFVYRNLVLDRLGHINDEDSIYTALLPNNDAWNEAYEKIRPYFNIPDVFGGAGRAHFITQFTIIQDLFYRGVYESPEAMPYMTSTNGNTMYNPASLFSNTVAQELSNGWVYQTASIQISDTASWFKPILVEAEFPQGRTNANSSILQRNSQGSGFDISDDRYIVVEPTGLSNVAQPSVTFQIPNTLSATYNIHVVFVPEAIVNPSNPRPNKANFTLVSINTTTGRIRRNPITPSNNVTDAHEVTRMHLGEFTFDFANVVDQEYPSVPVVLEVTNAVRTDETAEFSRTMRIDCIILEPVIE